MRRCCCEKQQKDNKGLEGHVYSAAGFHLVASSVGNCACVGGCGLFSWIRGRSGLNDD